MRKVSLMLGMVVALAAGCGDEGSVDGADEEGQEENNSPEDTLALDHTLPHIGPHFYEGGDTIYHQISPFGLTNQNGDTITHRTVEGQIYVADFFFTSCPGQCPKMTAAMKRVQQNCKDVDFLILSHTIDPRNDTAETFREYINTFGIDDYNWHFLTGDELYIKELGETSYLAVSGINPEADDVGDLHTPNFYLIDRNRHIRGFYDGTSPGSVDQLMADLRKLAEE